MSLVNFKRVPRPLFPGIDLCPFCIFLHSACKIPPLPLLRFVVILWFEIANLVEHALPQWHWVLLGILNLAVGPAGLATPTPLDLL